MRRGGFGGTYHPLAPEGVVRASDGQCSWTGYAAKREPPPDTSTRRTGRAIPNPQPRTRRKYVEHKKAQAVHLERELQRERRRQTDKEQALLVLEEVSHPHHRPRPIRNRRVVQWPPGLSRSALIIFLLRDHPPSSGAGCSPTAVR